MKELKTQLEFVESLFANFVQSAKEHIANEEEARTQKHHWENRNHLNKNCGKHAMKRKAKMIRQELLNLEKMIEGV